MRRPVAEELAQALPRLDSPWLPERAAALRELAPLVRARPDTLRAWLADPARTVRRAAAQLLAAEPQLGLGEELRAALLAEADAGVAHALLGALATRPEQLAPLAAEAQVRGGERLAGSVRRLLRAVTTDAVTARMRDGRVPGFYDGQFAPLWRLHPGIAAELLGIALDEGCHVALREIAVMALHETRRLQLERDLAPLVQRETDELADMQRRFFERGPGLFETFEHARFELSRYTRFALAKAGMTDPIRRMIAVMEAYVRARDAEIEARPARDEGFAYWQAEFLRGMLFETGYYYQQFDDYAAAERIYRDLLARFPESRACQNAHYNLACICAIQGRRAEALDHLREAIRAGFDDHRWLVEDGDLAPLRGDPEFQSLVQMAAIGAVDDAGRDWARKLRRFLPAGVDSFFALPAAAQEQVLDAARSDLTLAQRQRLVDDAPAEQRERLRRLILLPQ